MANSNNVTREDVITAYIGAFGRAPLAPGLEYWDNEDGIISTAMLVEAMASGASGEDIGKIPYVGYTTNYGYTCTTETARNTLWVERLYTNLFNKPRPTGAGEVDPELGGKMWWALQIANPDNPITFWSVLGALVNAAREDAQDFTKGANYAYLMSEIAAAELALSADPENQELIDNLADANNNFAAGETSAGENATAYSNKVIGGTQISALSVVPTSNPTTSMDINGNMTFSNTEYVATANDAYGVVNIDHTLDSLTVLLSSIAIEDVNYALEYTSAYDILLEKTMTSSHAPLEKMFDMIDAMDADEITAREKMSLKKDAYMQMLTQVTLSSQKIATTLVDKKFKFKDEVESGKAQKQRAVYEASLTDSKRKVMHEQVIDNRRIKAMESLGETYSTGMAGGLVPTEPMWKEYFRLAKELTRNKLEDEHLTRYQGSWFPDNPKDIYYTEVTPPVYEEAVFTITAGNIDVGGSTLTFDDIEVPITGDADTPMLIATEFVAGYNASSNPRPNWTMTDNEDGSFKVVSNTAGSRVDLVHDDLVYTPGTGSDVEVEWSIGSQVSGVDHETNNNNSPELIEGNQRLGWWQTPGDGGNGGVVVNNGFAVSQETKDSPDYRAGKFIGNYWTVNLKNWNQDLPKAQIYNCVATTAAVSESFILTVTTGTDGTTVTFDNATFDIVGTTTALLANSIADNYNSEMYTTWVAVYNGDSTVTFTRNETGLFDPNIVIDDFTFGGDVAGTVAIENEGAAQVDLVAHVVDEINYKTTIQGEEIPEGLSGMPRPVEKTNIPYTQMSITLDGINFWRHGDIVYVYGAEQKDGLMIPTYRRVAGLAAGTSVTVAGEVGSEDFNANAEETGI